MTPADIERMAREAGDAETDSRGRVTFSFDSYGLARFAELVQAAERERILSTQASGLAEMIRSQERERCAALCDGVAGACDHSSDGLKRVGAINAAKSCARLIRGG